MGDKESSSEGEFDHGDGSSEDEDDATIHINIEQSSSDDEPCQDQFTSTAKPLFFVYDCESTTADIYKDHIMEIAATTVLPEAVQLADVKTEFQSLVSTSRRILPAGTGIPYENFRPKRAKIRPNKGLKWYTRGYQEPKSSVTYFFWLSAVRG